MNRQEYLNELRQCLNGAASKEGEDAIRYCEEYFDEAGPENEQQAMEELGKPSKFAAQIKAEAAIRSNEQTDNRREKKPFHNIWMIFLGILALPLAVPLLLTAIALMFVFFAVVIVLIMAGFVMAAAGLLGSLVFFVSVLIIPFSADSIMRIGGGFLLLGLGLLLVLGMYHALHAVIPWFTKIAAKLYEKAKGGRTNEI